MTNNTVKTNVITVAEVRARLPASVEKMPRRILLHAVWLILLYTPGNNHGLQLWTAEAGCLYRWLRGCKRRFQNLLLGRLSRPGWCLPMGCEPQLVVALAQLVQFFAVRRS